MLGNLNRSLTRTPDGEDLWLGMIEVPRASCRRFGMFSFSLYDLHRLLTFWGDAVFCRVLSGTSYWRKGRMNWSRSRAREDQALSNLLQRKRSHFTNCPLYTLLPIVHGETWVSSGALSRAAQPFGGHWVGKAERKWKRMRGGKTASHLQTAFVKM